MDGKIKLIKGMVPFFKLMNSFDCAGLMCDNCVIFDLCQARVLHLAFLKLNFLEVLNND